MSNPISMRAIVDYAPTLYALTASGVKKRLVADAVEKALKPITPSVSIHCSGPPGHGKSVVATTVLPQILEDGHYAGIVNPNTEVPQGPTIHWSKNRTVCTVTEMLSTMEAIDLRGVQVPQKGADGKWYGAWITPNLVKRVEDCYTAGALTVILILDEFNDNDTMMQKAAADIVLNRRIGEYAMPQQTWVWLLSNRQQDGAGSFKALSKLNNRVQTFDNVVMPLKDFRPHMAETRWDVAMQAVTEYFYEQGHFATSVPTKDGPFLTPRSMEFVAQHVKVWKALNRETDPMFVPDRERAPMLWATVESLIGSAAAIEMLTFVKTHEHLPKMHEIVADPEGCTCPPASMFSAQFAASRMLIQFVDASNARQVWAFLQRLTPQLRNHVVNVVYNNIPSAQAIWDSMPEFGAFIAENQGVLAAGFKKPN